MYVYSMAPIDHWPGWQTVDQFAFGEAPDEMTREQFEALWRRAQDLAARCGWEGDIRTGPFITGFPDPNGDWPYVLIAWKQDNNGVTFVASPRRLPHLEGEGTWVEG